MRTRATACAVATLTALTLSAAAGTALAAVYPPMARWAAPSAALLVAGALGIGALHLGRPLKAWRAFLGWRTSWFSREVLLFGLFLPLATLGAVDAARRPAGSGPGPATLAAAITGLLAVGCSAMLYVDTRRASWSAGQCLGRFLGTTLLLGTAAGVCVSRSPFASDPSSPWAGLAVLLLTLTKLGIEQRLLRHWVDDDSSRRTPLNKTARLLAGPLGLLSRLRVASGLAGALALALLPLVASAPDGVAPSWVAAIGATLCLAAEGLERHLFFVAAGVNGMPGKGAT
ncbi:MAG TPA: hypothetical protein DCM86_00185 [Verrucomicrobiales bacterium]|nr:hypothetical protein [Verrucomicrobiales bacterium]